MPFTNQYRTFAAGEDANVLNPVDYGSSDFVAQGFQNGIAEAYEVNTVLRLSSVVAAAFGRFTADNAEVDVLDDGNVDQLVANFAKALRGSLGSAVPFYARDTSVTPGRVTVTVDAISNLEEGNVLLVRVANANPANATFRLNSRPSVGIVQPGGAQLSANSFSAGDMVLLACRSDGLMQMVGVVARALETSQLHSGDDTGAVNALIVAPVPPITERKAYTTLLTKPAITNTGAVTINDGLGAVPIVRGTGTALVAGDLQAGVLVWLGFDGQSYQILASAVPPTVAVTLPQVLKPVNSTPAEGALSVGATPTLGASAYLSLYGVAQGGSEWRIARDRGMTNLVLTTPVSGAGTTYAVPNGTLAAGGVYYFDVRYKDANNVWSERSSPTGFTTAATFAYLGKPVNTGPNSGETGVALTPTLKSSAFTPLPSGQTDTHLTSQWQVARDPDFQNVVYDSGFIAALVQHAVPGGSALLPGLEYFYRVRHRGSALGTSDFSIATSFRTQAKPNRPSIDAPANGAEQIPLQALLRSSAFSVTGVGTHAATRWQVSTVSNFASTVIDTGTDTTNRTEYAVGPGVLAFNTLYYVRVQHLEAGGQWSDWSVTVSFRTTTALNVGTIFAETPWAGNSGTQTIVTGIDTSLSGAIWSAARGGNKMFMFSPARGVGKLLTPYSPSGIVPPGEVQSTSRISDFRTNGFTAVWGDTGTPFNQSDSTSGSLYAGQTLSWSFGSQIYQERIFNHAAGTPNTFDFSAFGAIGMALLVNLDSTVGGWWTWHKDLPAGQNFRFTCTYPNYVTNNTQSGVSGTEAFISVAGTTVTVGAFAPTGRYALMVFLHDPAASGVIYCGAVTPAAHTGNDSVGVTTPVTLPWKPQFLMQLDPLRGSGFIRTPRFNTGIGDQSDPAMAYFIGGGNPYPDGTVLTNTGFAVTDVKPYFARQNFQRLYLAIRAAGS